METNFLTRFPLNLGTSFPLLKVNKDTSIVSAYGAAQVLYMLEDY